MLLRSYLYENELTPILPKSGLSDQLANPIFVSRNELVPIVMGARPEDYARSAPFKSYIHVDDFESPKELAEYLHKLDEDDNLYNEYFKWKVKTTKRTSQQ
jgi:hypothetical protein